MWGEAFCDTFRYFMGEELLDKESQWFKDMHRCLRISPEEIQDRFPNDNASDHRGCHNLKFKIPTSIIMKKVHENYGEFKNLWRELNERYDRQTNTFLEGHFDFKMKEEQERLNCRR